MGVNCARIPTTIDFVMDTSRLTATDILIIEATLRDRLIEHGPDKAVIATLGKVEKVLKHPGDGMSVPVHLSGTYPSLRCCGEGY